MAFHEETSPANGPVKTHKCRDATARTTATLLLCLSHVDHMRLGAVVRELLMYKLFDWLTTPVSPPDAQLTDLQHRTLKL